MASELDTALAKFQEELPEITKGAQGKIEGVSEKTGKPFSFGYDYADLGPMSITVLRLLGKHGLAWSAKPTMTPDGFMLHYALKHGASGETDEGDWPLPDPTKFDIKKIGGFITYIRRYCLMAVTGVAPIGEDQDAQGLDGVRSQQPRHGPERYSGSDRPHDNGSRVKVPVPGPDHERLRQEPPADRRWDGEDRWVDQPPGQLPSDDGMAPEDRPGSISAEQRTRIMAAISGLGITSRQKRLDMLSDITGRPIESANDLSFAEATGVEADLKGRKEAKEAVEAAQ